MSEERKEEKIRILGSSIVEAQSNSSNKSSRSLIGRVSPEVYILIGVIADLQIQIEDMKGDSK